MTDPIHEPWADLGRDLHYLGVANSLDIPKKLYEMGWRKHPQPVQINVVVQGHETDTHWANGMPRLLTPEAYNHLSMKQSLEAER